MALSKPSLVPGLDDEVLLGGLKEMQTLHTKTTWIVVHGPGMEFPLGPNLQKYIFTSNGADKRAPTDFLSMYDYMARVYIPKPDDVHPKPHPKIGASQYHSMFDYMITKHRAEVKRRSRRVYEKPSVIYKRGLPVEKVNVVVNTVIKESGDPPQDAGVQNLGKEMGETGGEITMRKSQVVSRNNQKAEPLLEDSQVRESEAEKAELSLRKSQVLSGETNQGEEVLVDA